MGAVQLTVSAHMGASHFWRLHAGGESAGGVCPSSPIFAPGCHDEDAGVEEERETKRERERERENKGGRDSVSARARNRESERAREVMVTTRSSQSSPIP